MHSINASASAAEVRPLHEHHRATRTVFSIDLLGYGFSERSDRSFTPRLMTGALHATVGQIRLRCGPVPVDPAGALPYFELPERFSARYDAFLAAAKAGTGG